MNKIDTARIKLQNAITATDTFVAADNTMSVELMDIGHLRVFRNHLVAMLSSIEGQAISHVVPESGMGRTIVDHWPIPENSQADVELNAVVRKVSEADYAYYRAVK